MEPDVLKVSKKHLRVGVCAFDSEVVRTGYLREKRLAPAGDDLAHKVIPVGIGPQRLEFSLPQIAPEEPPEADEELRAPERSAVGRHVREPVVVVR